MVKIASFIRRSLTLWFALIAWIGGSLSGDPYIRSGNMEIAKTLEYTYADGVSFCQGLATDGKIFYGIGCYKFLDYNALISRLLAKENCTPLMIRIVSKQVCSDGGPEGARTLDLSDANRTLSQTELQAQVLCYYISFKCVCQQNK